MSFSALVACGGPLLAAVSVQSTELIASAFTAVRALPQVDCPVRHHFVPGFYLREISMPRGAVVVSKKHLTEHQFTIVQGRVSVWDPIIGVQHLSAPYFGTTKAGTQRVLYIHEDTVWVTAHQVKPGEANNLAAIEARIIEPQSFDNIEIESEILKELQKENL